MSPVSFRVRKTYLEVRKKVEVRSGPSRHTRSAEKLTKLESSVRVSADD